MKPQTILFDLDDTLIHCNKYFDAVLDQFADLLSVWFAAYRLTEETAKKKQLEIDIAGVNVHGFTNDHFPVSLVKTYHYFSDLYGRTSSRHEEEELLALGKSVYNLQVEPYPGMVETLDRLQADGHHLYLYTGGVTAHQHKKIKSVKLETYFGDRIFVRQHKTAEALEEIVRELGLNRSESWMIGNSIRTDVMPALKAGLNVIYIPAIQEWEYNIVEITEEPKGFFLKLRHLHEVPDALSEAISKQID
jgi:putative hydrolase of the HAD superfamily